MLQFLDYLRKSQCTKVVTGRNRLGYVRMEPNDNEACKNTLSKMENLAKECQESSRFGFD